MVGPTTAAKCSTLRRQVCSFIVNHIPAHACGPTPAALAPRRGTSSFTLRHHNSTNSPEQSFAIPHKVARGVMVCRHFGALSEPARSGGREPGRGAGWCGQIEAAQLSREGVLGLQDTGARSREHAGAGEADQPGDVQPAEAEGGQDSAPGAEVPAPHGRDRGHQIVDHRGGNPGGLAQRRRQHRRTGHVGGDVAGAEAERWPAPNARGRCTAPNPEQPPSYWAYRGRRYRGPHGRRAGS